MLHSIGTRIALLIAGILAVSTLLISVFSKTTVEQSMSEASEESVDNIHQTVNEMLAAEFRQVLKYRADSLDVRRANLQDISGTVRVALEQIHAARQAGQISEDSARRRALDMLRKVRFFNNDYFFVYDTRLTAIAHPDPTYEGRNLTDFQDARGKYVLREIRDIALNQGSGFLDYWWKRLNSTEPSPKLGYVFFEPNWHWIIGTGVYIDDIDKEAERRMELMRRSLASLLARVRFSASGFFFVLDKDARVVVQPEGRVITGLDSQIGGRRLDKSLVDGTGSGSHRVLSQRARLDGGEPADWEFRVSHFAPLDWYLVSAVKRSDLTQPGEDIAQRQIGLNALILLLGLAVAALLLIRLIRGLRSLDGHARGLAATDFVLPQAQAEQLRQLARSRQDEVGHLAEAFLSLEQQLARHIENLTATTTAKERIESELRIARDIQMGILPKLFPAFPDYDEFDVHAMIEPARQVGGDLYDFFFIDDHQFCFMIGDVSGKGVPAAFFMAITKTLFKAMATPEREPGEVLARVNDDLAADNDACMFVTLFCGILDIRTGAMRYACAGHNPPVLLRAGGDAQYLPTARQPVAGGMEGVSYSTSLLQLQPGDVLFMYTDGVTEAMNPAGELYSDPRLLALFQRTGAQTPENLIQRTLADVRTHVNGAEPSDDITMMALRYRGPGDTP